VEVKREREKNEKNVKVLLLAALKKIMTNADFLSNFTKNTYLRQK